MPLIHCDRKKGSSQLRSIFTFKTSQAQQSVHPTDLQTSYINNTQRSQIIRSLKNLSWTSKGTRTYFEGRTACLTDLSRSENVPPWSSSALTSSCQEILQGFGWVQFRATTLDIYWRVQVPVYSTLWVHGFIACSDLMVSIYFEGSVE